MIAYLEGRIIELETTKLIVLTQSGVGYEVWIHEGIYAELQGAESVELFIYHHRTENSQNLFGFIEPEEKKLFEELIKINGIGGKVALNILSIGMQRLVVAISSSDNKTIEGIKGIGKKGASKIILELKDNDFIKQFSVSSENKTTSENSGDTTFVSGEIKNKVTTTLTAMGYNLSDIEKTLENLPESLSTVEEILPYVIRNM